MNKKFLKFETIPPINHKLFNKYNLSVLNLSLTNSIENLLKSAAFKRKVENGLTSSQKQIIIKPILQGIENASQSNSSLKIQNQSERMRKMKSTTSAPECLTITIDEAAAILGVSRSLAYSFIEQSYRNNGPIKVLKIGKCFRVIRASFLSYVLGETEVSA